MQIHCLFSPISTVNLFFLKSFCLLYAWFLMQILMVPNALLTNKNYLAIRFLVHLQNLVINYFVFLYILDTAKRLPRVQPAPNPSGMVLMDRPTERTASASCCSQALGWWWLLLGTWVTVVIATARLLVSSDSSCNACQNSKSLIFPSFLHVLLI